MRRTMRVARLVPLAVAALLAAACVDPSTLFTGRWVSEEHHDGVVRGTPVLALGHYGLEVAGVVYYLVKDGITYEAPCACAFVNHRSNDPGEGTLAFETVCDDVVASWRLALTSDPTTDETWLEGTVAPADGSTDGELTVRLRLEDTLVREEDKLCPPEPSR